MACSERWRHARQGGGRGQDYGVLSFGVAGSEAHRQASCPPARC
uniref:Uncharacterized protein n=1 Tax=Setaria italica TaxID=4555 RepID=K3ZP58_SETIT